MNISTSYQNYSAQMQNNTKVQNSSTNTTFADTMKTQSTAYQVDINSSKYNTSEPLFTDYFQSSGRAMKNQTSFNEDWVNPDVKGEVIAQKGVYIDYVPEEEVNRDKYGRTYLEQIPQAYFNNMTPEDKELFKEIMSDGNMSYGEVDSLTYEQVKLFNPLSASSYLKQQGYNDDEIVLPEMDWRVSEFIQTTDFTPDETFNRAIFKTVKEATNVTRSQINRGFEVLRNNLMQLGFDKPFGGNFTGDARRPYFLEKENFDINYDELLDKGISFYGEKALSPQPSKSATEEFKLKYEWYFTLKQNYEEVKKDKLD